MNIYFQTIFFPGAPRIHFIFEGIGCFICQKMCLSQFPLWCAMAVQATLHTHIFFNLQMKFYFDFEMFFFYYVVLSRVA